MRRIILGILLVVLILPFVTAQQSTTNDPGVTPDSFLWGLDKALEQIQLLLTLDKSERAMKHLEIAEERLLEVRQMVTENKLESASKGEIEHGKALGGIRQELGEMEYDDLGVELEKKLELEKELGEHEANVEEMETEIEIKIKGTLSEEQQNLIDRLITSFKGKVDELEVEIENEESKAKTKIKTKMGKSDDEIEKLVEEREEKLGLKDSKQKLYESMLSKAGKHINALSKNIGCGLFPDNIEIPFDVSAYTDQTEFTPEDVLVLINGLLAEAEKQEDREKAKDITELAKDITDRLSNQYGKGIGYWENKGECPQEEANEEEERPEIEEKEQQEKREGSEKKQEEKQKEVGEKLKDEEKEREEQQREAESELEEKEPENEE